MIEINTLELVGKLLERYESQHKKIKAYYGLLAYYGLAQAAVAGNQKEYLTKCKEYLSLYPDHFEHPHYNFEAYENGGNAKPFLLFHGFAPEWKKSVREYAERTLHAPADEKGILCMPHITDRPCIWIDVVALATPFMLYAGLALEEEQYIDFAANQCFLMYETFLDQTCGLLHQSRGFMPNFKRMSADHWSRGNGWCLIGLADLVQYLPADSKHREKAETYFTELIDSILPYQTERGLLRQHISEPLAWEESSGTALFLYALGAGIRIGLLKAEIYQDAFRRGIQGLGTYCLNDEIATYRSCPGCLCPGTGQEKGSVKAYLTEKTPQKDEVHSYGCFMLAFTEAYRNGISSVTIEGRVL